MNDVSSQNGSRPGSEEHPALEEATRLLQQGDTSRAVHVIRRALSGSPSDRSLCEAHGDALLADFRSEEAIGAFLQALRVDPINSGLCIKVMQAFMTRGLFDPAFMWLRRAMALDPKRHGEEIEFQEGVPIGRDQLKMVVDAWIAADPENVARRHLALAMLGGPAPDKADHDYVTRLFDDYAERYDKSLLGLKYRGHQLMAEILQACGQAEDASLDVLDVGCGTGLAGEALKSFAATLTGVDMSPNMLEQARIRGIYKELGQADMNEFMRARPEQYDLVTASDVITYTGDLSEFCASAHQTLRTGGRLVITCEALLNDHEGRGYSLNPSGRFSHSEAYLRGCFTSNGFSIQELFNDKPMRYECQLPMPSLVLAAEKLAQ